MASRRCLSSASAKKRISRRSALPAAAPSTSLLNASAGEGRQDRGRQDRGRQDGDRQGGNRQGKARREQGQARQDGDRQGKTGTGKAGASPASTSRILLGRYANVEAGVAPPF